MTMKGGAVAVAPRVGAPARWAPLAVALAATAAWAPSLALAPSSDEGGLLLLASQWQPGASLYGDYWVDRPPVLVILFGLADALGGLTGLRMLGMLCVAASVLLAAALPAALAPGDASESDRAANRANGRAANRAGLLTALATAALLCSPLFGALEVDGELLAVPWVLAGCMLLLRAHHATRHATRPGLRALLLLLAGVVGSAAWLIKQDFVDVFVLGAALALATWLTRRRSLAGAILDLAWLLAGLVLGTAAALLVAATHGTSPAGLWTAVVGFRLRATDVIATSAGAATPERLWWLVGAFALSAAPALMVCALRELRTGPGPRPSLGPEAQAAPLPVWPLVALLTWEAVAVAGGGSYWLHYLTGLVPGIALLVAAATTRIATRRGPAVSTPLAWAVAAALISTTVALPLGVWRLGGMRAGDAAVAAYLQIHRKPGDSAVVAYGHPDILQQAGLASPYPNLWSLPVRVRDPGLRQLEQVLMVHPPRWLVTTDGGLAGWGLRAGTAERTVAARYRPVYRTGDWTVLRRTSGQEQPPDSASPAEREPHALARPPIASFGHAPATGEGGHQTQACAVLRQRPGLQHHGLVRTLVMHGDLDPSGPAVDLEQDRPRAVLHGVGHQLGHQQPGDVDRVVRKTRARLGDMPPRHTRCGQV
ncbi:MAG TPA: hypothetical protein VFG88_02000 [Nocardioidaceae bacterium]|nr:hypothetical protein [Nocardioidaceae bacterium]